MTEKLCLALPAAFVPITKSGVFQMRSFDFLVDQFSKFIPRNFAETCEDWKQIIMYVVVKTNFPKKGDHVLAYMRSPGHTEKRLASLWSVGFGGHIGPEDLCGHDQYSKTLRQSMDRELMEELDLSPTEFGTSLGDTQASGHLIYHEHEAPVSRVHIGVHVDVVVSPDIAKRIAAEENADPEVAKKVWLSVNEAGKSWPNWEWEDWSKIVIQHLL